MDYGWSWDMGGSGQANVSAAIPLPTHVILKVYDGHSRPRERRPENAVAWEAKKSRIVMDRYGTVIGKTHSTCPVNPSLKIARANN